MLLSAGALVVGCNQMYYTRPGARTPATATTAAAERTAVWQHAVVALLDQGYVPEVLNESAGYINAKRREDLVGDALTGTMATVVVSPNGTVRVEVSGAGLFSSEKAFLSAVATRQGWLLQAITGTSSPAK
jgi:hypothetical protein